MTDQEKKDQQEFRDAIDIIANTPTGKGNIHLSGVPVYDSIYGSYATAALELLREYLDEEDEIIFDNLPPHQYGHSLWWWPGANIRINVKFRGQLGVVSSLLFHEGCHCLPDVRKLNEVEQEVICRTLQVALYRDLTKGITIRSAQSGQLTTVSLPIQNAPADLSLQDHKLQSGQLVDLVLVPRAGYLSYLTPKWIARAFSWWGGMANREPETKGHYLRILVQENDRYAKLILEILESMKTSGPNWQDEWNSLVGAATSEGPIDTALIGSLRFMRYSLQYFVRIQALQRHFRIDLGAQP